MKLYFACLVIIPFLCACGQQESKQVAASPNSAPPVDGIASVQRFIPVAASPSSAPPVETRVSIQGQVFVVTGGQKSIRLALVEVSAFPEDVMIEHIKLTPDNDAQKIAQLSREFDLNMRKKEKAQENFNKEAFYDYYNKAVENLNQSNNLESGGSLKGAKYFEKLPTPTAVAKTDADGRFTLTLPLGKYVIAAKSSRRLSKTDSEFYFWLVRLDTSSINQSLMLSNDNLLETACNECVQPNKLREKLKTQNSK